MTACKMGERFRPVSWYSYNEKLSSAYHVLCQRDQCMVGKWSGPQRLWFCSFPLSWLSALCSTVCHARSLSNFISALTLVHFTERYIFMITQLIICLMLFSVSKHLIFLAWRKEKNEWYCFLLNNQTIMTCVSIIRAEEIKELNN